MNEFFQFRKDQSSINLNQNVSILGCGWLGMPLATEFVNEGFTVKGSTTSEHKVNDLSSNGINPFLIDIENLNPKIRDFLQSEILIIAITSKNLESFKKLVREIEQSSIKKVIFISSTSVYPLTNSTVTEKSETKDSLLVQIENLFLGNQTFDATIIRFGGLFGYDRKPGNFFKRGKSVTNPEGYINLIHRDDCIAIIKKVIEKNCWDQIFNACADSHPKRKDFYQKEAEKLGRDDLQFEENSENQYKIVSPQKLKELLNYDFKYCDLMNY